MAGALLFRGALGRGTGCATPRLAHEASPYAEENSDWDAAVERYLPARRHSSPRTCVQDGLLRARLKASQEHFRRASAFAPPGSSSVPSSSTRRSSSTRPISTPSRARPAAGNQMAERTGAAAAFARGAEEEDP